MNKNLALFLVLGVTIFFFSFLMMPMVLANNNSLAYVYDDDTTSAYSYRSLLNDNGYAVTLIDGSSITSSTFSGYRAIIIGSDTSSGGYTWLDGDSKKVTAINNSALPLIGLGNGGYSLFGFGALNLRIGYDYGGANPSRTGIIVANDTHPIFTTPTDIPTGTIDLYTIGNYVNYIYLNPAPSYVSALGEDTGSVNYYSLCAQDNRYFFWGFTASPDTMTQVGKDLFINVIKYYAPLSGAIPSYNILLILGVSTIVASLIIIKKIKTKN
ncbi:MAG: hypothetical protein ACFFD5_08880 [Candidatus Thorarchaeota archaeon]